jgi:microcystin-dependent protein
LQFVRPGQPHGIVGEFPAAAVRLAADAPDLVLSGGLQVSGRVNGRDVAQDGSLLDILRAQVQALKERLDVMQASLVPVGAVALFGSPTTPPNWLPCDGALRQVADFPELAHVLGNRYGGDGVHTFATPQLGGRFPLGAGDGRAAGATGGSETHALTNAELPAHAHAGTTQGANPIGFLRAVHQAGPLIDPNHVVGYSPGAFTDNAPSAVPAAEHGHNFTTSQSPGCEGRPFPILPPFLALPYVIKAK